MTCHCNWLHCQFNRDRRLLSRLGNLHFTSLCNDLRFWWLGFLFYHHFLRLCFRGGYLHVCVH